MKNKNSQTLIIWTLVLLNLSLVSIMVFQNQKNRNKRPSVKIIGKEIERFIEKEIGLTETEAVKINKSRLNLYKKFQKLRKELKNSEYLLIKNAISMDSNSYSSEIQLRIISNKKGELSKLLHNHMVEIKNLCNEKEAERLRIMINRIFKNSVNNPPPPPRSLKTDNKK